MISFQKGDIIRKIAQRSNRNSFEDNEGLKVALIPIHLG